jgi:hypothetical protein
MAACSEMHPGTPAKQPAVHEATSSEKRRSSTIAPWVPKVATWVKVVLDKRFKRNLTQQEVPGVVSRVDAAAEKVNVLYPNKLSHYLYLKDKMPQIGFAIESYPLSKVQPWEGSTTHLDEVLIHAMLHFAERRVGALSGSQLIEVTPCPQGECVTLGSAGQMFDGHSMKVKQIKLDLKELVATSTAQSSSPSAVEVSRQPEQASSPLEVQKSFTLSLSRLFQRVQRDRMSKQEICDELGADFPSWEKLLITLDEHNLVMIAEDAVFRV